MLYEGQVTHGLGSAQNPSKALSDMSLDGAKVPQRFVPPVFAVTWIDKNYCIEIPNTQGYMEQSSTKVAHAKEMPLKEDT